MKASIDTHYTEGSSRTGLVLFENWTDSRAVQETVQERPEEPAEYVPGQFFQRELPFILAMLQSVTDSVDTVIIDGYVWLDQSGRKGLGAFLYEALSGSVNVIGVAKTRFQGGAGIEVLRGDSTRPLIVTAAGLEVSEAARLVQAMHGTYRIPTLIKRADHLSRHGI